MLRPVIRSRSATFVPAPLRPLWLLPWLAVLCGAAPALAAPSLQVVVEGVRAELRTNVRRHLLIWRERNDATLDERRIRRLHAGAERQIQAALRAYGHFRATVESELTNDAGRWRARYRIEPGPVIPIGTVELRLLGPGAAEPELVRLLAASGLQTGAPLDQQAYEDFKYGLQRAAAALGYTDAEFAASRIDVRLDTYRADIALALDTGPLYRFGAFSFRQQGGVDYDPAFVQRFLTLGPGERYRPQQLVALRTRLLDSQYFSAVELEPRRDQARDLHIPVDILTTADRTSRYRFGIGMTTDTGARVSARHNRVVNRSGHRLGLEARIAQQDQSALAEYRIPLADPATEHLAFSAGSETQDTDNRDSRILKLGAARTGLRAGWTETLGLAVEHEDFQVGGEHDASLLVMPNARWQRRHADHPLFPRHGWRLDLELLGSTEALGADVHFAQGRLGGKYILPLGDAGRLLLRGQAGATLTDTFDQLPGSKRFFAGGDQSVRGYQFEELGPRNAEKKVEGGRHLLVGSLEFDHRVTERWGAAAFVDTGNAVDGFGDPLRTGVGIGIRLRTPVGPVRLDLARGLDDPDADFRIHLSVGPDL